MPLPCCSSAAAALPVAAPVPLFPLWPPLLLQCCYCRYCCCCYCCCSSAPVPLPHPMQVVLLHGAVCLCCCCCVYGEWPGCLGCLGSGAPGIWLPGIARCLPWMRWRRARGGGAGGGWSERTNVRNAARLRGRGDACAWRPPAGRVARGVAGHGSGRPPRSCGLPWPPGREKAPLHARTRGRRGLGVTFYVASVSAGRMPSA